MSGHLQRIVAGVLHPERALHPNLGSRWAAPQHDAGEALSDVLLTSKPSEPRTSQLPARIEDHNARMETGRLVPEESQTVSKPPVHLVTARGSSSQPASGKAGTGVTQTSETGANTLTPARLQAEDDEADSQRSFLPLLPLRPEAIRNAARGPTMISPTRPLPAQAQSVREKDEIEIHIGRIEVTAAAPAPVQRPPARLPVKSPDLGEYLTRGRRSR